MKNTFSAFADDSTIFWRGAVSGAISLHFKLFWERSGLWAQPIKIKFIFLTLHYVSRGFKKYRCSNLRRRRVFLVKRWTMRSFSIIIGLFLLAIFGSGFLLQEKLQPLWKIESSSLTRLCFQPSCLPRLLKMLLFGSRRSWRSCKTFLRSHATWTVVRRHNFNPSLLVTPRKASEVGIASFQVTIKTHRTKHALMWLTVATEDYFLPKKTWNYHAAGSSSELVAEMQPDDHADFLRYESLARSTSARPWWLLSPTTGQ